MSTTTEEGNEEPTYLESCPDVLPADKPVGHPHLIECEPRLSYDVDRTKLRLADGIATVLYNYDPEFLRKFLDLKIYCITFNCHTDNNVLPSWDLMRLGGRVTVSVVFSSLSLFLQLT